MKHLLIFIISLLLSSSIFWGCNDPVSSESNEIDTVFVMDTKSVTVYDTTIIVNKEIDTIINYDTLFIMDTTFIIQQKNDTIIKIETIIDTIIIDSSLTEIIYDTIFGMDTLIFISTEFDTLYITKIDTLNVIDTLITTVNDTIIDTVTIFETDTLTEVDTLLETDTIIKTDTLLDTILKDKYIFLNKDGYTWSKLDTTVFLFGQIFKEPLIGDENYADFTMTVSCSLSFWNTDYMLLFSTPAAVIKYSPIRDALQIRIYDDRKGTGNFIVWTFFQLDAHFKFGKTWDRWNDIAITMEFVDAKERGILYINGNILELDSDAESTPFATIEAFKTPGIYTDIMLGSFDTGFQPYKYKFAGAITNVKLYNFYSHKSLISELF